MSTEPAFLQAILDEPDDDTPRLVLADWLDDHGDPERAELIRVQCELARWVPDLDERTALRRRERQLLEAHRDEWLGGGPRCWKACRFERGLPSVTMTAGQFLALRFADRAQPLLAGVEEVRLVQVGLLVAEIAVSPQLATVRALDLDGAGLVDDDVRRLARSPFAGGLVSLNLANNRLSTAAALALHDAPALASLRRLDLRNNDLGPLGVKALTDTDPTRLPVIELHGNVAGLVGRRLHGAWAGRVVNSIGMELMRIPSGTFLMGSPREEAGRSAD